MSTEAKGIERAARKLRSGRLIAYAAVITPTLGRRKPTARQADDGAEQREYGN
jgi:hypothetical protein